MYVTNFQKSKRRGWSKREKCSSSILWFLRKTKIFRGSIDEKESKIKFPIFTLEVAIAKTFRNRFSKAKNRTKPKREANEETHSKSHYYYYYYCRRCCCCFFFSSHSRALVDQHRCWEYTHRTHTFRSNSLFRCQTLFLIYTGKKKM